MAMVRPLMSSNAFLATRVGVTMITVAALFTGLYVHQPLRTVCGVIYTVGGVSMLVLTWIRVWTLRKKSRDIKRQQQS